MGSQNSYKWWVNIPVCFFYHKCSHSSLHSTYGEGDKERQRVNVLGYHVLHTASPFQPSRLPWATVNEEALINHPYTGPVQPWHLQTLIFFCLLSHAAAILANQPWEVSILNEDLWETLSSDSKSALSRHHSSLPPVWTGVRHLTKAHLSSVRPWLFSLPFS